MAAQWDALTISCTAALWDAFTTSCTAALWDAAAIGISKPHNDKYKHRCSYRAIRLASADTFRSRFWVTVNFMI